MYAIWFESSTDVLFKIVSDANYVIIINNFRNIPDRRFDCNLVDFCCECFTINYKDFNEHNDWFFFCSKFFGY